MHPHEAGPEVKSVCLRAKASRPSPRPRRRRHEITLLELDDVIDSYSYGTLRKLALLGVLGLRRPVLLLNEPFEALDVVSRRIVRHLLRRVGEQGQAVIFSAHDDGPHNARDEVGLALLCLQCFDAVRDTICS